MLLSPPVNGSTGAITSEASSQKRIMTYKKKLIEVALPLEAINVASAREKSIRHGHPSTLHLWWSRKPLATCRAILFASLVDDPSSLPEEFPTEAAQDAERQRLFRIIEELVLWENSNEPRVLEAARAEILKSTNGNPPPVLDPFCGGGSIPLEAQRLGLEAHGSDLNPVAVLITKALIEIPPKFAGQPPVNPEAQGKWEHSGSWPGATGLAEDVRYYGKWMRDEAEKRIGYLYPKAKLPDGGEATVIAWIWVRTVKCPNPACGCQMPLSSKFVLSTKPGKQVWIEPLVDENTKTIRFTVKTGTGKPPEGTVGKRGAICLCCNTPVPLDHVRAEGKANRMGSQMMAIVADDKKGRVYLPPTPEQEAVARQATPDWTPNTNLPEQALGFRVQGYGMTTHSDLFTNRQLVALTTFCDLVHECKDKMSEDSLNVGLDAEKAMARSSAVDTYIGLVLSRLADYWSSLNSWQAANQQMSHTFARQAIAMVWDYVEGNPFNGRGGSFDNLFDWTMQAVPSLRCGEMGICNQTEATEAASRANGYLFSTDPPYYDNVPYADLSDFFYVWLRHSLGEIYPDLFGTMLVPKTQELIAEPFRHGGKDASRQFFEDGMKCVFTSICKSAHRDFPVTVYYAFKQSEAEEEDTGDMMASSTIASTGWETMLQGLLDAGFQVTGTWPMRTELGNRMRSIGSNALASSIVLVCRPRPDSAKVATRREFVNALRGELEEALLHMMHGNIAPVDLAQATIGPGMAVYSRYKQVVETDGKPLRVRAALQIINQELDTVLASTEGEYDGDTRFCIAWFEQYSHDAAPFGDADVMARAKNTSVAGIESAGVLEAKSGKVRLLKREEYPQDWNPKSDTRVPVWECTQQLVRALQEQGEGAAARLCAALGSAAEPARDLAYRLYSICERKGWAQEALAYNSLVIAWPEISRMAANPNIAMPQIGLFAGGELE